MNTPVIVCMFILGIFIYIFVKALKETGEEQKRNRTSSNPYLIDTEIKYLTGFPDKIGDKEYRIKVYRDKIGFSEKYYDNRNFVIWTKDLIDSRIASENFIREQISLGKMLAFGIFSLAMKKKEKKQVNNYLQLEIMYQGKAETIIFEVPYGLERLNTILRNLARQQRTENNVVDM